MTSERLYQFVQGLKVFRGLRRNLEANDVYSAATLAQIEILRDCFLLEEKASLTLTAGKNSYSSAESGLEWIARINRVNGWTYPDMPYAVTGIGSENELEAIRRRQSGYVVSGRPIVLIQTLLEPATLLCYPTPDVSYTASVRYARLHTGSDDISDSVDPIIPDRYKDLLIWGTAYQHLIQLQFDPEFDAKRMSSMLGLANDFYERLKNTALSGLAVNTGDLIDGGGLNA